MTTQDVLDVFDSFGDKYVPAGALRAKLEEDFDLSEVAPAINKAIADGDLAITDMNSIYRP